MLTATPFGFPVEPEVKMIQASSAAAGSRGPMRFGRAWSAASGALRAIHGTDPGLAEHHVVARSSGSSASTGTYAAPTDRVAENGDVQVGGARRDADADPVAVPDAARAEM